MGSGESILLVQPSIDLRNVVEKTLESSGYKVLSVGSREDAINLMYQRKEFFQLVITDLLDGDGIRLAEEIKELDPKLPLVLFSINADTVRKEPQFSKLFSVLVDAWRGNTRDELLSAVRNALDAAHLKEKPALKPKDQASQPDGTPKGKLNGRH